ncbi:MAG: DUF2795 domain-containing protein [Acidimicrobiia bacterium]
METAGPAEVQGYLEQVDYPTTKAELLEAARRVGANPATLAALAQLPDRDYGSRADVSDALGKLQFGLNMDRREADEGEHGLVIGPEDEGGDLEEV